MSEVHDGVVDGVASVAPCEPPRILVVDDDATLVLLMSETLKGAGFSVMEAVNGAEAVAKCREFRPNLVLLDIEMPEMDGFSACAEMRRDASGQDLPISRLLTVDRQFSRLSSGSPTWFFSTLRCRQSMDI